MSDWDERLSYFLILAQLLSEADMQLQADAKAPDSVVYGEHLATLRASLGLAISASAAIMARVQARRVSPDGLPAFDGEWGSTLSH